jgi:hypothetical protein
MALFGLVAVVVAAQLTGSTPSIHVKIIDTLPIFQTEEACREAEIELWQKLDAYTQTKSTLACVELSRLPKEPAPPSPKSVPSPSTSNFRQERGT